MFFCGRISPGSYLLFLLFKLVVVDKGSGFLWTDPYSSFMTGTWGISMHVRSPASELSWAPEQVERQGCICG